MIHFHSNHVNTKNKVALKEGKKVRDIPIEGEWQPLGLALKTVGDGKDSKQTHLCICVSVTGLFGISVVFYFCA